MVSIHAPIRLTLIPLSAVISELTVPGHRVQRRNSDRPSSIIYDSRKPGLFREKLERAPPAVRGAAPAGIKAAAQSRRARVENGETDRIGLSP